MEWRGVTTTNVYIGNFFFVAGLISDHGRSHKARADLPQGIGMVISAQWELVLGNTYAYTVLSAFGLFYGGFGAIITPLFGVAASYGTDTAQYNNALGFFVLSESAQGRHRTDADATQCGPCGTSSSYSDHCLCKSTRYAERDLEAEFDQVIWSTSASSSRLRWPLLWWRHPTLQPQTAIRVRA